MNESFDPSFIAKYERETWGRCADNYSDTFAGITQETFELLKKSVKVQAGSKMLDLGSGPGTVAGQLAAVGAEVTGVDFSSEMVEIAQRRYPQIEFKRADAEELPFEAGSFDAVVANYVVHHLARPERVFGEICRVLRPSGRFAFAVWGPPEQQSSIGAFFGAIEAHHDLAELPHGPLFGITDRDVYEPMLAEAGMELRELAVHETSWKTRTLDTVLRGFWDWGGMDLLSSETQAKIEHTTRVNAGPYRCKEGYSFPHSALVGCAIKP